MKKHRRGWVLDTRSQSRSIPSRQEMDAGQVRSDGMVPPWSEPENKLAGVLMLQQPRGGGDFASIVSEAIIE